MAAPSIVVVNTSEGLFDLLDELLGEQGYTRNYLVHVDDGYQTIRRQRPDLVILDVPMEQPDKAWLVLDLLCLSEETTGIPVIVCSTDARLLQAKAERLRQQGYYPLEKPFTLAAMVERIEAALGPLPVPSHDEARRATRQDRVIRQINRRPET